MSVGKQTVVRRRRSDGRWQAAPGGRPPALVADTWDEAMGLAAEAAAWARQEEVAAHLRQLIAWGMTPRHIAEAADLWARGSSVLDVVDRRRLVPLVPLEQLDRLAAVELELTEFEWLKVEAHHAMQGLGMSREAAVAWVASQCGVTLRHASAAVRYAALPEAAEAVEVAA